LGLPVKIMEIKKVRGVVFQTIEECDILIHDIGAGILAAKATNDKKGAQKRQQIYDCIIELKRILGNDSTRRRKR